MAIIQTLVSTSESIPNPKPTPEQIKKFVKDTIDGNVTDISLSGISIPTILTKEELEKQIEEKIPTKEELEAMAFDAIKDKIPDIPYVNFVPPTLLFTPPTNILIGPFINAAKQHLMGTGGTISVISQYPPPAPPAPAIISWNGYRVIG